MGKSEQAVLFLGGIGLVIVGAREIITAATMPTGFIVPGLDSPGTHMIIGTVAFLCGTSILFLLWSILEKAAKERDCA
jgi:hypothetical protein